MIYEQIIDNRDTPILVSYDNGEKQFVMYRNTKRTKTKSRARFIVVMVLNALYFLLESILIGIKGLKK